MPNKYALYQPTGPVSDPAGTRVCPPAPDPNPGLACGNYAVNTIQPTFQPTSSNPLKLPPQHGTTIGDELSAARVSWAWYSGGWSNADGDVGAPGWTNGNGPTCADPYSSANPAYPYCPNKVFQFHHQAFNYYANYAPGMPGRSHLQDEQAFIQLANASEHSCKLNSVSFIKPIGLENEHPGYTGIDAGSNHLVDLIKGIEDSRCAKDTMIVVTYDEFGGQWDHVAPPGQGTAVGPHDQWGPGTRIPALIIAPRLRGDFVVDSAQHDTTSILATMEHRFGLAPLGTRDAAVKDLSTVFRAREGGDGGEGGGGGGSGGGGDNTRN
jgi:phospholipase C